MWNKGIRFLSEFVVSDIWLYLFQGFFTPADLTTDSIFSPEPSAGKGEESGEGEVVERNKLMGY